MSNNNNKGKSEMTKSFTDFEVDQNMNMAQRTAAFLDWAAHNFPMRPVSYTQIAKIVYMLSPSSRIGENDARVKSVHDSMTKGVKKIMKDKYHRGLVPQSGFGIRATVDDTDYARTRLERDANRATAALKNLDESRSMVKVANIADKDLRVRVLNVNSAVKTLMGSDIMAKLLPPKKRDENASE